MTVFGKRIKDNGFNVTTTDNSVIMSSAFGFWKQYRVGDTLSNGRVLTDTMLAEIKADTVKGSAGTWTYNDGMELKRA